MSEEEFKRKLEDIYDEYLLQGNITLPICVDFSVIEYEDSKQVTLDIYKPNNKL